MWIWPCVIKHTLNWLLSRSCVIALVSSVSTWQSSLSGASCLHCVLAVKSHYLFRLCTGYFRVLPHMCAWPWALNDLGAMCCLYLLLYYEISATRKDVINTLVAKGAYLQSFQDGTAQNKGISCQLLVSYKYCLVANQSRRNLLLFFSTFNVFIRTLHRFVQWNADTLENNYIHEGDIWIIHPLRIIIKCSKARIRLLNQMRERLSAQWD